MPSTRAVPAAPELDDLPAIFRPADLSSVGLSRNALRGLLDRGVVESIARGLYRKRAAATDQHETVAMVAKRIPHGIVCLLTALEVHELGTQAPREVWIAIDRKARKPTFRDLPIRIVRFSGPAHTYGVIERTLAGVPVRLTSPARTVVDCFRYRRKIGLDVALEALRDALRSGKATPDEIQRAAETCRALTVVRPYLESFSHGT